jgi:hypothetical protein
MATAVYITVIRTPSLKTDTVYPFFKKMEYHDLVNAKRGAPALSGIHIDLDHFSTSLRGVHIA